MSIGIIGYGSMGKMLLERFEAAKNVSEDLYVSNRNIEKIRHLSGAINVCSSNNELAMKSDILIICVRPTDIKSVLEDIKESIGESAILISLNGSVSFETLAKVLNHRMAKVIPSITAEINRSQTLICYNERMTLEDKQRVEDLFDCIGNVIVLPEDEMGMGSELVSCMPGFIASIFDVLCSSAKHHTSIPNDRIIKMVLHTMCSTGELMLEKNMTFDEVVERVATKGGITEEGTKVVYDLFPKVAEELFHKTLDKREKTAQKAEEAFKLYL